MIQGRLRSGMSEDSKASPQQPVVRRSHRLYLQLRVRVHGNLPDSTTFSEETVTLVVNAHGALIKMEADVRIGQTLIVQVASTGETQKVRVVFISDREDGKLHVGVELISPNAHFWHVSFPPEDWSPSHPDAKAEV